MILEFEIRAVLFEVYYEVFRDDRTIRQLHVSNKSCVLLSFTPFSSIDFEFGRKLTSGKDTELPMRLTHIDVPSLQPSFTVVPPTRLTPQPGYREEFSKTNREVTRLSSLLTKLCDEYATRARKNER